MMTGMEWAGNEGFTQPMAACFQSIPAMQISNKNENPISETKRMINFSIRR